MDPEQPATEGSQGQSDETTSYRFESSEPSPRRTREGVQEQTRIALILLGLGKVGRALLRQIQKNRLLHESAYSIVFDVVAVSDSSAALLLEDPSQLGAILDWKERGQQLVHHSRATLTDAESLVEAVGEAGAIVIDCTASEDTLRALLMGVEKGCRLVTANKRPLTGNMQAFRSLCGPFPGYPQCRWSSTVGAGLPIISTLNRLRAAGDDVQRMTGSLSSTLGNLFSGLDRGHRLSTLIQQAIENGVAEPDPREDLSGRDLARKALILARTAGWKAELSQVEVEPLYPESMRTLPVEDFLQNLTLLDQELDERCRAARANACSLRYGVEVSRQTLRVGIREIPNDHPLGRLHGSEQLIAIETALYRDSPLLLQGRGAGVEATASGMLADILELCRF